MIKIAHESPKSIFNQVQNVTDYDYALVHLFEEDPEYLQQFKEAKEKGREIILDNSIFELEEAFDAEKFAGWVLELRPDWYIVPDALEDAKKTCSQMAAWNIKYKDLPGKKIGVVQGKTYKQINTCYEYMDKTANVDMIAISFDYSYYVQSVPHPNKYVSWMMGRVKLLGEVATVHLSPAAVPLSVKVPLVKSRDLASVPVVEIKVVAVTFFVPKFKVPFNRVIVPVTAKSSWRVIVVS